MPTPSPSESASPSITPSATPQASETPKPTPSPSPSPKEKKKGAPATISAGNIIGYDGYQENVRKVIDTALELTTRNLDYKYG